MIYTMVYKSPLGDLLLAAKNNKLIGTWFFGQKYFLNGISEEMEEKVDYEVLLQAKEFLDEYFLGHKPNLDKLNLDFVGSEFRQEVFKALMEIPYGEVVTYKDITDKVSKRMGKNFAYQAVGGAIAHNPISIIVPCHRVVSSTLKLTGYAGGIEKKKWLLEFEKGSSVAYYE